MYLIMNRKKIAENAYQFKRVYNSLPANIRQGFRRDMMVAMCCLSRTTFYRRMEKGTPEPTVSEFESMKKVFSKYKILNGFDHELNKKRD